MSIHPQYAVAIMDGKKKVEFRKKPLATDISTVLVYATAPYSRVIGSFTIRTTVEDHPRTIWNLYNRYGYIDEESYFAYFNNRNRAVAIEIQTARKFHYPLHLDEIGPAITPPQSFRYLPSDVLETTTAKISEEWTGTPRLCDTLTC